MRLLTPSGFAEIIPMRTHFIHKPDCCKELNRLSLFVPWRLARRRR